MKLTDFIFNEEETKYKVLTNLRDLENFIRQSSNIPPQIRPRLIGIARKGSIDDGISWKQISFLTNYIPDLKYRKLHYVKPQATNHETDKNSSKRDSKAGTQGELF